MRRYTEWDLDEIPDCWISPKAFRGTGAQLKELLAVSAFGSGNDPATAFDTAIGGAFELKVRGGLTVKEWKKDGGGAAGRTG